LAGGRSGRGGGAHRLSTAKDQQDVAHFDPVVYLDVDLLDLAAVGGSDLDSGLVRLDAEDQLLLLNSQK
jgi:hypothetical protein